MKGAIKQILTGSALVAFFGCSQEPEKTIYKGPDFVFLDSKPQVSLYENQKTPLNIPIKVSLAQSNNTLVTFEVIGTNILPGSDYQVQTASPVEILRSKYESVISILPVDNNVIQPEVRTIIVRILGVDNPNLTKQVVTEVQVNLLDDDCDPSVPKVSTWVGKVNIQGGSSTVTGDAEGGTGGICGGSLVVTGNFFGTTNPSSTFTIRLIQNSVTPTTGIASVSRSPLFSQYEYEASGTYDETGRTIILNYSAYDTTDGSVAATGTHIITPQ